MVYYNNNTINYYRFWIIITKSRDADINGKFLPDDDVVQAEQRINNYFGAGYELMMIYIENENIESVVSAEALNEIYNVAERIKQYKEINDIISVAGFVDTICQLEFNKSLKNCTLKEVDIAFQDLMSSEDHRSIKIMENDDNNGY